MNPYWYFAIIPGAILILVYITQVTLAVRAYRRYLKNVGLR